jgi:hypothetical protein
VEADRPAKRVTDLRVNVAQVRRFQGRTRLDPMPRIPRRSEGSEEAPPEDQRTQLSSGDPLAPPSAAPQAGATSGDPLAPAPAPGQAEVAPETPIPSPTVEAETQPTVAAPAVEPVEQPTTVLPASGDPLVAPAQPTAETGEVSAEAGEQAPTDARPRFRQRTRMRRRLRYLRRLRELAFRDLGGLVFDLHRFNRDRNDLVTAKLEALANIDRELRTLQGGLHDRHDFTDLREAGIAACPRCGTLHDTDANFCPGCGTTLRSAIVRDASPVVVTAADDAAEPPPTPAS